MLLTRALDDHLKRAFDKKEIRWGDYPSPQKGFRSTGQEAIVGAALRTAPAAPVRARPWLSTGTCVSPLIRDLGRR